MKSFKIQTARKTFVAGKLRLFAEENEALPQLTLTALGSA